MADNSSSSQKTEIGIKIILKALGSHLRTQILSQLATGDKYVLQLVKTLGKTQQDIHRNLNYLEQLGLVKSFTRPYKDYKKNKSAKPSKGRRYFTIDHSFMLQINLAPNQFDFLFKSIPIEHVKYDKERKSEDKSLILYNVQTKNLTELSNEILELNHKRKILEEKQLGIFIEQSRIRNLIVDQINQFDLYPLQSMVLNKLIGELPINTEELAEELNLNPKHLLNILESLKKCIPLKNHEGHWSL